MPSLFGSEGEVIQARSPVSPAALLPLEAGCHYRPGATQYQEIARRIIAALRARSGPFVLVTGDPPADPEALSEALGDVTGSAYSVCVISCGPDLKRDHVDLAVSGSAPSLFVFADFDRLSEEQIGEICGGISGREGDKSAVLLTSSGFLSRLQRPRLQFLKERISAQFRFGGIGDDEAMAFLYHQLLAQRDNRVAARGFRRGILIGLGVGGIGVVASFGAYLLQSLPGQVGGPAEVLASTSRIRDSVATLQPAQDTMPNFPPTDAGPNSRAGPLFATARPIDLEAQPLAEPSPPAPVEVKDQPSAEVSAAAPAPPAFQDKDAAPTVATPPAAKSDDRPPAVTSGAPAGSRLSPVEIAALLARGDAFLGTGDITSARLFYERAAEAESGLAALRLGKTFDPAYPVRAGLRFAANPAQALLWYRRARELGIGDAAQRIHALESQVPADSYRTR
jgi:hypothetical protein